MKEAIRFHAVQQDPELVAVAEVLLHEKWGVYLRGWYVLKRGGQIEVLPPHKVYRDPATGEEKIFSLLFFESAEMEKRWVGRVKEEYLNWAGKKDTPALPSMNDHEESP